MAFPFQQLPPSESFSQLVIVVASYLNKLIFDYVTKAV